MSNSTSNNNRQHHVTIRKSISVSTRTASSSPTMLMLKLVVAFVSLVSVWFNLKMHDHQQHEMTTTAETAVEYYSENPSVRSSSKSSDRIMSLRTTNTNTTATKQKLKPNVVREVDHNQMRHSRMIPESLIGVVSDKHGDKINEKTKQTSVDKTSNEALPSSLVVSSTVDLSQPRQVHIVTSDAVRPISSPPDDTAIRSLSGVPNDDNTAITMIAMGENSPKSFVVERCIRSVRVRGKFNGLVVLFTDHFGYETYQKSLMKTDNNTIVVLGLDEDLQPTVSTTISEQDVGVGGETTTTREVPRKYAQRSMVYKRFKTLHSKYLQRLGKDDTIRFVLYIDIDNLIGAPLSDFFHEYHEMVQAEYKNRTALTDVAQAISFASFFRDTHLRSKMHGGIIMYDRQFETGCTDGWRWEMDHFWHGSDQNMLLRVLNQTWSKASSTSETIPLDDGMPNCYAFALPPQHLQFATRRLFKSAADELPSVQHHNQQTQQTKKKRKRGPPVFPTFMHLTSYRLRQIGDPKLHDDFLRYVLDVPGTTATTNQRQTKTFLDGVSWDDMVASKAVRPNLSSRIVKNQT